MLSYRGFCWTAIILSSLSLASGEQTKPPSQLPINEGTSRIEANEVDQQVQAERNKVPVRQLYEEMFTKGRYELLGQAFAARCPVHFGSRNVSLQQAVAEGKGWRSAAPDMVMTINELTVNGDMVTAVWTCRGTHTGNGHGLKPTGRKVLLHGKSQFRVANGKIVEAWNEEYRPELFRQLGVSKAAAFVYETADGIWSLLPDRLYALLQ
jgi:predicted ester cyclase